MDIDTEVQNEVNRNDSNAPAKPKISRLKGKKKTRVKSKVKNKPGKSKAKKKAKRPAKPKSKGKKKPAPSVVRSERLDMRLSKAEKSKVATKAKKLRRTVTSLVLEAIEKLK